MRPARYLRLNVVEGVGDTAARPAPGEHAEPLLQLLLREWNNQVGSATGPLAASSLLLQRSTTLSLQAGEDEGLAGVAVVGIALRLATLQAAEPGLLRPDLKASPTPAADVFGVRLMPATADLAATLSYSTGHRAVGGVPVRPDEQIRAARTDRDSLLHVDSN